MCCEDLNGVYLISPQWTSFIPGELQEKGEQVKIYISLSMNFKYRFQNKNCKMCYIKLFDCLIY